MDAVNQVMSEYGVAEQRLVSIAKDLSNCPASRYDELISWLEIEVSHRTALYKRMRKIGYAIELLNQFVDGHRN